MFLELLPYLAGMSLSAWMLGYLTACAAHRTPLLPRRRRRAHASLHTHTTTIARHPSPRP